jgi:uncharacterized protein
MTVYFLDSSALVKRYICETGTDWIASLFSPDLGNDCFVAAIAGVEIIAAITRLARSGSIKAADAALACAQFKQDFQATYQMIEITAEIISLGMSLAEAKGLRGYDAVQLAWLCRQCSLPNERFAAFNFCLSRQRTQCCRQRRGANR